MSKLLLYLALGFVSYRYLIAEKRISFEEGRQSAFAELATETDGTITRGTK